MWGVEEQIMGVEEEDAVVARIVKEVLEIKEEVTEVVGIEEEVVEVLVVD